jgi:hypothetical protein
LLESVAKNHGGLGFLVAGAATATLGLVIMSSTTNQIRLVGPVFNSCTFSTHIIDIRTWLARLLGGKKGLSTGVNETTNQRCLSPCPCYKVLVAGPVFPRLQDFIDFIDFMRTARCRS